MKLNYKHRWDVTPKKAIEIQNILSKNITLEKFKGNLRFVAGVDASYRNGICRAYICILKYPELTLVKWVSASSCIKFPYIPGLLTFREGPTILKCIEKINHRIDVFLFDGQGIAHPRRMGIASHIGLLINKPTIGCAKGLLYGKYIKFPDKEKGSYTYIMDKEEKIGIVLRTRPNTKPVFVSPGYKIDLHNSLKTILGCAKKYRIPEPLRIAHHLSLVNYQTGRHKICVQQSLDGRRKKSLPIPAGVDRIDY